MKTADVAVENNEAARAFEARVGGQVAVLDYERKDDHIVFTHTGVPPALEGHGLASKLAHAGLEYARTHDLRVVPLCPFVAAYISKHPEYQALIER